MVGGRLRRRSGIAICRRTLRATYEAKAHGILGSALLHRDGPAARHAIEEALANAASLIERSGEPTLAPELLELRAELAAGLGDQMTREQLLRQAPQGYEAIGAPGQVVRLARKLAS